MNDILTELAEDTLTVQNVLELVDDYSLFCYYLGFDLELHTRYSSPLRPGDNNPSFSVFQSYSKDPTKQVGKLYFKDQATGISGDVIDFLITYFETDLASVLKQVNYDLNLCIGGIEGKDQGVKASDFKKDKVLIKERVNLDLIPGEPNYLFRDYWEGKYQIEPKTTSFYQATQPKALVYKYADGSRRVMYSKTLCISYEIFKYYKFYWPFEEKQYKFRNNFPPEFVEGYMQLDKTAPYCIITKANKECMWFRQHFNLNACAGKSETTKIPPHLMMDLFSRFPVVFLWLDADTTGQKMMLEYMALYPNLKPVYVPAGIKDKDPTDYHTTHGLKSAIEMVNYVLNRSLCQNS